ncbi:MAG: MFS transporter [Tissierellia bacterium]|nr:MFS transporter [Tissierellia bacterium]
MSNNEVAIPLSPKDKKLVTIGSWLLMFYIACGGTTLAISQSFILRKFDAMHLFSLSTIIISLGAAIMTPIGGKLSDIIGIKKLVIISVTVAVLSNIALAFGTNITLYFIFSLINSLSKGAFTASPAILAHMTNKKSDVPKVMGYLASAIAGGTFIGALIAGRFNDMGLTEIGITLPAVFVLIAGLLIMKGLPNIKMERKITLDYVGIVLLAILITSFVLSFNFGPTFGWTNPYVLVGFAVLIASAIAFVSYESKVEKKGQSPIIAMSLFKNKEFSALLLIGLIAYYYQAVMTNYGTLASLEILGESATISSMLTMPRMAITLFFPIITGVWVSKKSTNSWKAIALSTIIVAVAFLPLVGISPSMSIMVLFASFTVTGIAEGFRAVSITPAAQELLTPENLSTGTALVNFMNTLSSVFATTISGVLFNAAGDDKVAGMQAVFISTIVITLVGFVLVLTVIRKNQEARYKELTASQAQ